MQATTSLLKYEFFVQSGKQIHISSEYLYYQSLRDRFINAVFNMRFTQKNQETLLFDGDNPENVFSLFEGHGLLLEDSWHPERSLLLNADAIKTKLIGVWKDQNQIETQLMRQLIRIPRGHPEASNLEVTLDQSRRTAVQKIEAILQEYSGQSLKELIHRKVPQKEFESYQFFREFFNTFVLVKPIEIVTNQQLLVLVNSSQSTFLATYKYTPVPDKNYYSTNEKPAPLTQISNKLSWMVSSRQDLKKVIVERLNESRKSICISNWFALSLRVQVGPVRSQDLRHMVLLDRLSDDGKSIVIQNSHGSTWGNSGFLEIPIDILIEQIEAIYMKL